MNNNYKVAYGILLTDNIGYSLNTTCSQCFDNVRELYDELGNDISHWLVATPGKEYHQFLLGFEITVDKNMDIHKIHKDWLCILKNVPISILERLDSLGEPNIHILSNFHNENAKKVA